MAGTLRSALHPQRSRLILSAWLALAAMAAAVALIAYCAPEDADQGLSQKIFYFHVPMALRAYACVLLVELAGKRIDLRLREFKHHRC